MVAGCTWIAERFGTNVGGIIGGFPSTIAVSLFFIGFVSSPDSASAATQIIPLVVGFNGIFLVCFAVFGQRGLLPGFTAALIGWGVLAGGTILSGFDNFRWALAGYGLMLVTSFLVLNQCLELPVQTGKRGTPGMMTIFFRAVFSGSLIATSVLLSRFSGPVVGGMFSVFPAAFISTLLIVHYSQGLTFARALTKPLLISGMINVVVYSICVRYFYLVWGLGWGTVGALGVSAVTAYGTFQLVRLSTRSRAPVSLFRPVSAGSHARRVSC